MMHDRSALFLDTPAEHDKRVERMVGHLRHAEYVFLATTKGGQQTPAKLIWILLQDAMQTCRRMPDIELGKLRRLSSVFPRGPLTEFEAHVTMAHRFKDGMSIFDQGTMRSSVHEADIDRMIDVLDMMRFVRGHDAERQKRVVLARAAGLSLEQCGRIYDRNRVTFHRQTMHDLKQIVIGQIFKGMETHFGLVRTGRFFRRIVIRNIEERRHEG